MEPEGTVEIKFKNRDLLAAMQRLDPTCVRLHDRMSSPDLESSERAQCEKELRARQEVLLPMYHQVAVEFADLHDRAGRMQEKGVIVVSG